MPSSPAPARADDASDDLDLPVLRREIDDLDTAMLDLLKRRRELTVRIGRAKAGGETCLRLKPDREDQVLARLAARSAPDMRTLTRAVWREVMAAGLAEQEAMEVLVWTGENAAHLLWEARHRFGAHPTYRLVDSPAQALERADAGAAVAVLAMTDPWWTTLAERHPDLWAFELLRRPHGDEAQALAVGRVDPGALAAGPVLRVVRGGDADLSLHPRRPLHAAEGWTLRAEPDGVRVDAAARHAGVIGRAATLAWRAPA